MPVLFPFKHNWRASFTVTRMYRTSVIRNRAFNEQRIAERARARLSVSVQATLMRDQVNQFLALMASSQQGEFFVPDFSRFDTLTAEALSGQSILELGFRPPYYAFGQSFLLESDGQSAVYQVAGLPTNQIVVVGTLAETWPVGTRVTPLYRATIPQDFSGRLLASKAGEFEMNFEVLPGTFEDRYTSALPLFNGRPIWMKRPNWIGGLADKLTGYREVVDFDRGVVENYAPINFNSRIRTVQLLLDSRAEAEEMIGLFNAMRGQQGEFYFPTWQDDLSVSIGAGSGSNSLTVPGRMVFDNYAGSTVYRAAVAIFRDGTHQANRITAINPSGQNTTVSFASSWSRAINASTTAMVSFLPVWRFASDESTVEWLTSTVAETTATMMTLEDV